MTIPVLPGQISTMMAGREHRVHHYLWHTIRDGWFRFDQPTRKALKMRHWDPPRPAVGLDGSGRRVWLLDNDSGEDFFYMHRQMIAHVNAALKQVGQSDYPKVEGWKQIPAPGDTDYPVPPAWDSGDARLNTTLNNVKSDEFYETRLLPMAKQLTDDGYLATVSLGKLGAQVESTVHNWLHMRFCARVVPLRPDNESINEETIDQKWDEPSYDWLGDTYSSHVNPVFWKIHGWVDDRIEQWARVHKVSQIAWKGTWVGNMPGHVSPNMLVASHAPAHLFFGSELKSAHGHGEHGHGGHGHGHGGNMEEVLGIVLKSGVRCHFYDDLRDELSQTSNRPQAEKSSGERAGF